MIAPSTPAGAGQDSPGRRSSRSGAAARRRRIRIALAALAVVAVLAGCDMAMIDRRLTRVDVGLTTGPGTTWVLVGLDSRADLPEGATAEQFGTTAEVPGSRADVVVVVHEAADGVRALSVPRDLMVRRGTKLSRLAETWLDGPQATVDALCTLGVPTDHLVAVDLAGFAGVVDALGGLDVEIPAAVRDPGSGLLLEAAGQHHVDGTTALALVRSRHPEHRVDGRWVPTVVDPDGRAAMAGTVLTALADAGDRAAVRPWRLQRAAWAGAGALTVDADTSLADLAALARGDHPAVDVLPVSRPVGRTIARVATDATDRALAEAGLSCRQ